MMQIEEIDPREPEAATLLQAMDADVAERYGSPVHSVDVAAFIRSAGVLFVGRVDGLLAASGGIQHIEDGVAEVKRLFVCPAYRRRGLARSMLTSLEGEAGRRGYHTIRLATGNGQPEALALYGSMGYRRIPSFGEYCSDPLANCFEKRL